MPTRMVAKRLLEGNIKLMPELGIENMCPGKRVITNNNIGILLFEKIKEKRC